MTQSIKTNSLCRRALQQRNQRVNQYRALVTPIAVHYCRRCPEPLDDLVQVGLMGLLRAAELYQPQTATPFEAFARPHIRGAILHYLRDSASAVRVPRRQMELHDSKCMILKILLGPRKSLSLRTSRNTMARRIP